MLRIFNTIYEFHGCFWHGCFWHGCPICYPVRDQSHLRLLNRTMADVYYLTQKRTNLLRERVSYAGNVGMSIEQAQKDPGGHSSIRGLPRVRRPTQPLGRLLWGTNQCHPIVLLHKTYRRDTAQWLNILLPLGEQTATFPKFISHPGHTDITPYFGLHDQV